MNFITDNYVWFIIIGVVILMAVIGYIADKTDFGRKGKSDEKIEKPKKENKKKESKPKENKIKIEAKGINELSQKLVDNQTKEEVVDNINQNVTNSNLGQPTENIDQALFAPLTDEKTVTEGPVADNVELKNVEPAKLENPVSPNVSQSVADDEDIWKF